MNSDACRIIFWGTPQIAADCLSFLYEKYNVVAVVSQPDKPVGRNYDILQTPVKQCALTYDIPVLQPEKLFDNLDFEKKLKELCPDLCVVFAYGKIIPKSCLEIAKYNINLHFSLLPQYRGAAPVQRALIDGRKITGITVQHIAYQLDQGDIILQDKLTINDQHNTETLMKDCLMLGVHTLKQAINQLIDGKAQRVKQDETQATYAHKLEKADGMLEPEKQSAEQIFNIIRGCNPWPGAVLNHKNFKLKIWKAKLRIGNEENPGVLKIIGDDLVLFTKSESLILEIVQQESKNKMTGKAFANGKIL